MTRLFRLSILAAALGAPLLLVAPAGATAPPAAFEEVAQASPTEARPRQRQRRPRAQAPRRQRQQGAQRTRQRRAPRAPQQG